MPKLNGRLPKYRKHKGSGQAVVTIGGDDVYLGPFGSPESIAQYDRLIARWLAAGRQPIVHQPPPVEALTIDALVLPYWEHVKTYYRHPDGRPTTEVDNIRQALRPLRRLYGKSSAVAFGPQSLETLRQHMIELGWCRTNVNKQIHRIGALFRWAASKELIPITVYQQLKTLAPLRRGRTNARETPKVKPVPGDLVAALEAFVSKQVWAMIQLQILSGARPEDVVGLRLADLKVRGTIWMAEPEEHKTAYRGHRRVLYFGPRAQAILKPFMNARPTNASLFNPQEAEDERHARMHARRRESGTPLSCGNRPGTHCTPSAKRRPRDRYTVASYRRAIQRACDQAFPPPAELARQKIKGKKGQRWETPAEWKARLGADNWAKLVIWQKEHRWHPHQLRHNAATEIRREFGVERAKIVLGVRSIDMAELYGERDEALAIEAVSAIG